MAFDTVPMEVRHFHLFAGLGGGAKGFNRGKARVGNLEARFRCIGGVDVDRGAMRDFEKLAGLPGTVLDLFDRDQYRNFWDREPPADWREATPQDIQRAAGGERPHIVFLSAPCKGFSGLLSATKSKTAKYVALNRLTLRGVWLMLEAWRDDPVELIVFENVPMLLSRGRALVDQIMALLRSFGYAAAETVHDCGKLGGLAQSRKRCLIVARHIEKVPPLLYQPDAKPLRAVGDVLGRMLMPGDLRAGPMHRIPRLSWKTWVRLAFVEAGSDWRSLNRLAIEDGNLRDYLLMPTDNEAWHRNVLGVTGWDDHANTITGESRATTGRFSVADPRASSTHEGSGYLGVRRWGQPTGVVAGESRPSNGAFSVADPRAVQSENWNAGQNYGVHAWSETSGAVTGQQWPNQGRFAVADPRVAESDFHGFRVVRWDRSAGTITGARAPGSSAQGVADPRHPGAPKFSNELRVAPWQEHAAAVTSAHGSGQCVSDPRPQWDRHGNNLVVGEWDKPARTVIAGGKGVQGGWLSVADPRGPQAGRPFGKYHCAEWDESTKTVIGSDDHGAYAVADPRSGLDPNRAAYLTGGHFGVVPWQEHAGAVSSAACHDNGRWSVADPRIAESLPAPDQKLVARITSEDGTWHRPFTTLELAALQSLIDPEEQLELDGLSDSAWRERIGNAVPPDAAEAIASEMGRTLLLAWSGETFQLSASPIWVRPMAMALSIAQGELAHDGSRRAYS